MTKKMRITFWVLVGIVILCVGYVGLQEFNKYKAKVFNSGVKWTMNEIYKATAECKIFNVSLSTEKSRQLIDISCFEQPKN